MMHQLFRSKFFKRLLLIVSIFFIVIFCVKTVFPNPTSKSYTISNSKENFDIELTKLKSIKSFTLYIDSIAKQRNINIPSQKHIALIANLVSKRFFHQVATYNFIANPFIWLVKIIKKDINNVTLVDDLMKYDHGICSQQINVFLHILNEYNYTFRTVHMPTHIACEVKTKANDWWYIDIDQEQGFNLGKDSIVSLNDLKSKGSLNNFYRNSSFTSDMVDKIFGSNIEYSKNNNYPDQKGTKFQTACFLLFYVCVALSIIYIIYSLIKRRTS